MQHEPRRVRFLDRPFWLSYRPLWRDWVIGYILIGVGFSLGDYPVPDQGLFRLVCIGVWWMLMIAGGSIFLAAIGHAVWHAARAVRSRDSAA